MTQRPMYDNIIVRPDKQTKQTKSGIILAQADQEEARTGTVVAAGPGYRIKGQEELKSLVVKPGDRVVFAHSAGNLLKMEEQEVLVMREADLFGILEVQDDE